LVTYGMGNWDDTSTLSSPWVVVGSPTIEQNDVTVWAGLPYSAKVTVADANAFAGISFDLQTSTTAHGPVWKRGSIWNMVRLLSTPAPLPALSLPAPRPTHGSACRAVSSPQGHKMSISFAAGRPLRQTLCSISARSISTRRRRRTMAATGRSKVNDGGRCPLHPDSHRAA
jgi:hypothetical protein